MSKGSKITRKREIASRRCRFEDPLKPKVRPNLRKRTMQIKTMRAMANKVATV